EAAQRCIEAAAAADPGTPTAGAALHFAASCLLGLGRIDDALATIAELRTHSRRPAIADFLEAQAELQRSRPAAALALLDGIDDLVDDQGKRLSSGVLPLHRGMALAMLERWKDAAAALSEAVAAGAVQGNLGLLVSALGKARRPIADLAALFDEPIVPVVIDEVPGLSPDDGHIVCRALWERLGATGEVVALVAEVAPSFGLELALEWSIRLRQAGAAENCPLLRLADDESRSPSLRVYA